MPFSSHYSINCTISLCLVKLAGCKNALTPTSTPTVVCSTDRSEAVVPVLVLLFVALWFILRGDLFLILPYVILFLCFSVISAFQLPRLGKREPILVFFVRLFDLRLFGFVFFSSSLCLGRAAACYCGTSITTLWEERANLPPSFPLVCWTEDVIVSIPDHCIPFYLYRIS